MEKIEKGRASYHDINDELRPHGFYGCPCLSCTIHPHGTDVFIISGNKLTDPDIAVNFAFFSSDREKVTCTQKGVICMPLKNDRLPNELRISVGVNS